HSIVHYEDVAHLGTAEAKKVVEQFKKDDREAGFHPESGPLMRIALFRTAEMTNRIIWSFHHILMDGWCFGILFKDFLDIYRALLQEKPVPKETVVPYGRYIQWLEKQNRRKGLDYWANYVQDYEQQAVVPKQTKAGAGVYRLEKAHLKIDGVLTHRVNTLATEKQVTLNTLFQTYWGILLQKYNNTGDVVFGAVVSGRPPEIEGVAGIVGLFINTVPVRIKQEEPKEEQEKGETFSQLVTKVQRDSLEARSFEYLPLAEIQAQSYMKNRLIDHIFVFENFPVQDNIQQAETGSEVGFAVTETEMFEQTNYDFNIMVAPAQKELIVQIMFNAAVYEPAFINRILKHLDTIIRQTLAEPGIETAAIDMVTNEEKKQLLLDFNDSMQEYPREKTLHQLFAEQVEKAPDSISLVGSESLQPTSSTQSIQSTQSTLSTQAPPLQETPSSIQLTYRELDEKSNRLAAILRTKGVEPDSFVGIMTGRTIEMIIGILGILKTGAAYLPISPDYPEERINFMLTESKTKLIVKEFKEFDELHELNELDEIHELKKLKELNELDELKELDEFGKGIE
ncbi:MAG: AMP-binding protein, partial [bacterium]|nr:AMP-binding protein [bacterium]